MPHSEMYQLAKEMCTLSNFAFYVIAIGYKQNSEITTVKHNLIIWKDKPRQLKQNQFSNATKFWERLGTSGAENETIHNCNTQEQKTIGQ